MFLKGLFWYSIIVSILLMQKDRRTLAHVTGNMLTNEVVEAFEEEDIQELPFCRIGSACGYLQANAFGINQQQFCRCPSMSIVCPLIWDSEDGHSVTMGSEQYKFCDRAPNLHICRQSEPSYTHAILFDQVSFNIIGVMNNLHCLCPPPRAHVFYESSDEVVENMHSLGSVLACAMLPPCDDVNTPCKEISITKSTNLITSKCQCQRGYVCPTLSQEATPNDMNTNFINGKAFSVRCLPWF